ncbi:DUF4864 domain-containing protein [Poseidonocella sp. HB161398]|uniref:DUF4864 domain-containing protein n=1 Tax=Poseidonocella sp. HB161398 TaxID=2320855 RepID=UPI00148602A5|nr:DUF4864 domain-containing protein [Poseidonocella sp. HB161398]
MSQEDRGAAIRSAIDRQLAALRTENLSRAYGYVSRNIRGQLGSAQLFAQLMRQGFPMAWDVRRVGYLPLRCRDGLVQQRVTIRDSAGRTHVLEYDMAEEADGWKIDGLRTLPLTGLEHPGKSAARDG